MLIQRKLYKMLVARIHEPEIVVITGMRRVGKTTLLKMLYDGLENENKAFLDLENPLDQDIFEEKDFNNIWANLKGYGIKTNENATIFIDEAQAKPDVIMAIKYLYDHYGTKFYITGSSSFYLRNLFPESLAGRKIIHEMRQLDFDEFLQFKGIERHSPETFAEKDSKKNVISYEKIKTYYDEYLKFGGFPQVALVETTERKTEQLKDIYKSYFEKEVQALSDFKDISAFRELVLLLAGRIGSKMDIAKLSREVGVARQTVSSYVNFLQMTYFLDLVPPFSRSVDREVSGAKKPYISDNGLIGLFGNVIEPQMLENAVFQNIKKYGKIHYYERRGGREIDFVIPEYSMALEVKSSGSEADVIKLRNIAGQIGMKESYVISKKFSHVKGIIPALDV